MCNLYRMTKTADEVAKLFDAVNAAAGTNLGVEIYPGYPGLVLESGHLRQMNWGFPLQVKGAKGQPLKPKPVNNARTDKLGDVYSMVMTDAAGLAAEVHRRMPVVLRQQDYAVWLGSDPDTALELCRPWAGDVLIDSTDEPWSRGAQPRLF